MAGEWIKMRTDLWDDPRVGDLCVELDVSEALVCGGLFRLWALADSHTQDGVLPFRSAAALDRKIGIDGFAAAVQSVGWLEIGESDIRIVRFDEHNGASAKKRAADAKRASKKRGKVAQKANDPASDRGNVPKTSQATRRNTDGDATKSEPELEPDTGEESPVAPSCPTTALAAAEPPTEMVFPTTGKGAKEWALTEAKLAEYVEAYPALDVPAEMRKARQWCRDNAPKRKTAKGMPAFLTRWLNHAQNSGQGRANDAPAVPRIQQGKTPGDFAAWASRDGPLSLPPNLDPPRLISSSDP
ncbi:hypothetical protein [Alienimonas chondri]|uniref:Uncharacterized protein n=1 Tax=Alienimonas chondri TaxID=2681879 RepID=A0ABX1VBB2_9PLAN|nr:hypothetical protein [Alienimonas chondri]NNJ24638.1 hypothetical protein [Alienimonas chondri]